MKRIIVPIVCFTLLGRIIEWTRRIIQCDMNWIHYVLSPIKELFLSGYTIGNFPLWFLTGLLGVRMVYSFASRFLSTNRKKDVVLVVLFLGIFLFLAFLRDNDFLHGLPLYLYTIPLALVFFLIARILRGYVYDSKLFLLSIVICVILNFMDFNYVNFMTGKLKEGNSYLMFILMSICAIVIVNNIFRFLYRYYQFPLLTFIGRNSMTFFVLHLPILLALDLIIPMEYSWNAFVVKVIVLGVIITTICLMKKQLKIKWMFGE